MKFKTWEKIYWAIISILIIFNLITTFLHEGDIPVTVGKEEKFYSKGTYIVLFLLGYAIIFVPIWLIIRWIINRGDNKSKDKY